MSQRPIELPSKAFPLAIAGQVPQSIALIFVWTESSLLWEMETMAFCYAALILSFVGGIWWGLGISLPNPPKRLLEISVAPALLALIGLVPAIFNLSWPGPSLVFLGSCLALSPAVDRWIGFGGASWFRMRLYSSLCLGAITAAIGFRMLLPA